MKQLPPTSSELYMLIAQRTPFRCTKLILWHFPLLFTLLASCSSDTNYVRSHQWKYGEGFHVQDWLDFRNGEFLELHGDTIFLEGCPIAIVSKVEHRIGADTRLELQSMQSNEIGTYFEK